MGHESTIPAIRERVCEFLKRQHQAADVTALARRLGVEELELRQFVEAPPSYVVDPRFLIELLVAVVREFGVDCSYLLTGAYSFAEHCHVENELRSREEIQQHVWHRLSECSRQTSMGHA